MNETDKDARIAALESALVDLWHVSVYPSLMDQKFKKRFIAIDRKIRELGLTDKLKRD